MRLTSALTVLLCATRRTVHSFTGFGNATDAPDRLRSPSMDEGVTITDATLFKAAKYGNVQIEGATIRSVSFDTVGRGVTIHLVFPLNVTANPPTVDGTRASVQTSTVTAVCEIIASGASATARACSGNSVSSNCRPYVLGLSSKQFTLSGTGSNALYTAWCGPSATVLNRELKALLDTPQGPYTYQGYVYGTSPGYYSWTVDYV